MYEHKRRPVRPDSIEDNHRLNAQLRDPNGLDPGIIDIVIGLREDGFRTFSSCEGGNDHAFVYPTVLLYTQPFQSLTDLVEDFVHWASNQGHKYFDIHEVRRYNSHAEIVSDYWIHVEFWGLNDE